MKNRIFQFLWFYFFKGSVKRKSGNGSKLSDYSDRMNSQIKLAQKFGNIDLFIIGDSNAENLAKYSSMVQIGEQLGLCVNIAVGGTRADTWVDFFKKEENGKQILHLIKSNNAMVLFNIGGNHVLQNAMDLLPSNLEELSFLFPNSFNCLIPPIHSSLISSLNGVSVEEIANRIAYANSKIKNIWGSKAIDTYSLFVNPNTNGDPPYWFVHRDMVHFSHKTDKMIRIPFIVGWVKMRMGEK